MCPKITFTLSPPTYYREKNVQTKHLSSLTDEDLTLIGIKNPIVRQSLLEEFAQLPSQVEHYEK